MSFLIQHYLDKHAEDFPNSLAVTCLDENLSYVQLQNKANQLANSLIAANILPGDRVGIYMDKCLNMAVAVYGILKAGAVYVPLDPLAPTDRLSDIIENCNIRVLLSHSNKQKNLVKITKSLATGLTIIGIEANQDMPNTQSWDSVFAQTNTKSPQIDLIESDLAYIIYTSGSTGLPKGIMHTHHSCLSYVRWCVNEFDIQSSDRIGNHCPLHFDISIFDWFAAAVAGASLIIIPDAYTKMPASYAQLIANSEVSILFTVPFALIQLSQYGDLRSQNMQSLRSILFGGEPMHVKHLDNIMQQLPHVLFYNVYGPAEVNGCTLHQIVSLDSQANAIPIGKMFGISQGLILDENNLEVGPNESGELLVRSPTMMQGYWARADLNQQCFFFQGLDQAESSEKPSGYRKVFYRTGDLVKRDDEGLLWFIGRRDRQVKVRGYRVELDEIEASLVLHNDIEEAAVFCVKIEDESMQIHAGYTLKSGANASESEVSKFLRNQLPRYAMPSKIALVQSFPRTTSGKIDRNKLSKESSYVSITK